MRRPIALKQIDRKIYKKGSGVKSTCHGLVQRGGEAVGGVNGGGLGKGEQKLSTSNLKGKTPIKCLKLLFEGGMDKLTEKVTYRGGLQALKVVGDKWEVGGKHYVGTEVQPEPSNRPMDPPGMESDKGVDGRFEQSDN